MQAITTQIDSTIFGAVKAITAIVTEEATTAAIGGDPDATHQNAAWLNKFEQNLPGLEPFVRAAADRVRRHEGNRGRCSVNDLIEESMLEVTDTVRDMLWSTAAEDLWVAGTIATEDDLTQEQFDSWLTETPLTIDMLEEVEGWSAELSLVFWEAGFKVGLIDLEEWADKIRQVLRDSDIAFGGINRMELGTCTPGTSIEALAREELETSFGAETVNDPDRTDWTLSDVKIKGSVGPATAASAAAVASDLAEDGLGLPDRPEYTSYWAETVEDVARVLGGNVTYVELEGVAQGATLNNGDPVEVSVHLFQSNSGLYAAYYSRAEPY